VLELNATHIGDHVSSMYNIIELIALYAGDHCVIHESCLFFQSYYEEMLERSPRRKLFNDYAKQLMRRYPNMKDEISVRLSHLNNQWERLQKTIAPSDGLSDRETMLRGVTCSIFVCLCGRCIHCGSVISSDCEILRHMAVVGEAVEAASCKTLLFGSSAFLILEIKIIIIKLFINYCRFYYYD